ncbi:uncharacterized protein LOC120337831 [Styela clava]
MGSTGDELKEFQSLHGMYEENENCLECAVSGNVITQPKRCRRFANDECDNEAITTELLKISQDFKKRISEEVSSYCEGMENAVLGSSSENTLDDKNMIWRTVEKDKTLRCRRLKRICISRDAPVSLSPDDRRINEVVYKLAIDTLEIENSLRLHGILR